MTCRLLRSVLVVAAAAVVMPVPSPAGATSRHQGWAIVREDDAVRFRSAANGDFGGVCVLGQTNRVSGNSYPKSVEFSGGARCSSEGQPVAAYQEGKATLYKGVRDSYLGEGNEVFGLQDWSVSRGTYGGGTRDLRYTNNLILRLTTPDGKPWAVKPSECDRDRPDSVVCNLDKPGRVR